MVRQTRNVAAGKEHLATEEEKQQAYDYHHNTDSLYHAGIDIGEGSYDPEAGASKHPLRKPESEPTPVLATDPGQPKGVGLDLIQREQNKALDKSERGVVRSTGRKAKPEGAANDTTETSESRS